MRNVFAAPMANMTGLPLLLAAFVLGCGDAAAAEASFARAALTDFTVSLRDLEPTDGIDPYLLFPDEQRRSSLFVRGTSTALAPGPIVSQDSRFVDASPGFFSGSLSSSTSVPGARSTSVIDAGAMRVEGSADGDEWYGEFIAGASDQTSVGLLAMQLSPHTELIFTAHASLTARVIDRCVPLCNTARASVIIDADIGEDSDDNFAELFVEASTGRPLDEADGLLELSVANRSADPVRGWLRAAIGVNGYASPVPEPSTLALTVAGLALLGVVHIRRRRRVHA